MTQQFTPSSQRKRSSTFRLVLGIGLALGVAIGAFFSGLQFGQGVQAYSQGASLFSLFASDEPVIETSDRPNLDEFWEVWDLLEEKFALSSSSQVIVEEDRLMGAIQGLVESYEDPYTTYLPPKDAEMFDENISGNFGGVGMEVGMRDRMITVISPLPDTPAEMAGIMAGDVIVSIDGTSTEDMTLDEAVRMIRGEQGTEVSLKLYREGESDFLTIPVVRDTINIPTVKTEEIDGVFIIALYSFNAISEAKMHEALIEYIDSGAGKLVIDVRGNPGGFLQSAVSISSYFLPSGKVVVKEQFSDSSQDDVFRSRGRRVKEFTPDELVVLIDGGSASASEILAGALRDHGVATLIGADTFGKGSVQELVKLDGGASLKVTVARWLTPNGVSISDGGLSPDIVISRTGEQRLAGEDPQKDAAVRFLNGEEVESEKAQDELDTAIETSGE
tara:strand:- start:2092 stop:3429 length:1338 start_codon:yes stop_codon:yes gene_type:complete